MLNLEPSQFHTSETPHGSESQVSGSSKVMYPLSAAEDTSRDKALCTL